MAWHRPTNVNEWLSLVLRHKKKFFFPAVIVATLTLWFRFGTSQPEYYAEAKFQRTNDPAMVEMGASANLKNLAQVRQQLWEDIMGRAAIQQLIYDLNLTQGLPRDAGTNTLTREASLQMLDLINQIRQRLSVSFQNQGENLDVIVVGYRDRDPERAKNIANKLVSNYMRKAENKLDELLTGTRTFFKDKQTFFSEKVRDLTEKKLTFELNNPGLKPDDPASARNRKLELSAKLEAVSQDLQTAVAQRDSLRERIKVEPEFLQQKELVTNPEAEPLLQRKQALQVELDQLRAGGRKDEHPLVKKARQRIADLEQQIAKLEPQKEVTKNLVPNMARQEAIVQLEVLNGTIAALERQKNDLAAQVERYEVMDRNFFAVRAEYLRLQRQAAEAEDQLKFWEDNLRRVDAAYAAEAQRKGIRYSELQAAQDPGRPVSPTIWSITSVSLALGLAVGLALVVLAELFDGSFHSVEQATDGLKLPILGAVNEIVTPTQAFRQRVLAWGVYPGAAALLLIALVLSLALIYLALADPPKYELVRQNPLEFVKLMVRGG